MLLAGLNDARIVCGHHHLLGLRQQGALRGAHDHRQTGDVSQGFVGQAA
jgi:hypothetical protein